MFQRILTAPEIGLIAGTRMALGIGIGLLISGRLSRDQRKAAGVALTVVGAATTIPLAVTVINRGHTAESRRLAAA
jgi:multisubunit Na+/H+ antiporter MnhB subunit